MNRLITLFAAILLLGCQKSKPLFDNVLCIKNVNIIDAEQGLNENHTVIIQNDRIIYVGAFEDIQIGTNSEIISADSKYLIPGLWDTHVHFAYIEELAPSMFDLFLAYGITSVRDTGGELNFVLKWKYLSDKNPTTAPRVKVAGPLLDGNPNVYDGSSPARPKLSIRLDDTQDVLMNADILIEAGVDFLKAYEMLTPEQFTVINNYAASNNLKVTGHVPLSMDVISASDAGFDSMEHLRNLELSCSKDGDKLLADRRKILEVGRQNNESGSVLRSRLHEAQRSHALENQDSIRTEAILNTLLKNQTWQIPTLALLTSSTERPFLSDEWKSTFELLPTTVKKRFYEGVEQFENRPVAEKNLKYSQWGYAMTKKIHEKGIGIMAGTDSPISFLTPGRSLHQELQAFSKAGIPPLEILRSATLRPAEYFNMQDELGLIKEGYLADLVLLSKNPLADINNTLSIHAVIKGGQLHTQEELLRKLKN